MRSVHGEPAYAKVTSELKQELARTLVTQYHGAQASHESETEFERVFATGGTPDEIAEVALAAGSALADLLATAGLVPSKNEARRMIEQGAVTIDGERAGDPRAVFPARAEPYLVKVGKRRFAKLRLS
jgi:tyrosyl-tRNA synthetase